MILEWIFGVVASFLGWLLGLFPTVTVPEWVNTIGEYATDGVTYLNGMHNWIPLTALQLAFTFLAMCGLLVLTIRGFRIVLSLFTGGGGSAA